MNYKLTDTLVAELPAYKFVLPLISAASHENTQEVGAENGDNHTQVIDVPIQQQQQQQQTPTSAGTTTSQDDDRKRTRKEAAIETSEEPDAKHARTSANTSSPAASASVTSAPRPTTIAVNEKQAKLLKEMEESAQRILQMYGEESQHSEDPMEKELSCAICSEIFHKPVSVLPCLHNFCATCLSQWIENNTTCPQCRQDWVEIRKNHALTSMLQLFIKNHPKRARSDETVQQLDAENKNLTDENLRDGYTIQVHRNRHNGSNDDDEDNSDEEEHNDDDEDEEEDDEDDEDIRVRRTIRNHHVGGFVFGQQQQQHHNFAFPALAPVNNNVCRECIRPGADGFQCTPTTNHLQCSACMVYMPIRNDLPANKPQRCAICTRGFCHQYYGHVSIEQLLKCITLIYLYLVYYKSALQLYMVVGANCFH